MTQLHLTVRFDLGLDDVVWLYGVKSTHSSADDTYNFSNLGGTFILDGAGLDTIVLAPLQDVTIDLRPGSYSHLGSKSLHNRTKPINDFAGSDIENVVTGSGDDTVIGTNLDNVISTGNGSDTILQAVVLIS